MKLIIKILILFFFFVSYSSSQVIWADRVVDVSSEFDIKQYSADQVLGMPKLPINNGTTPLAWRPRTSESLTGEYIHVAFPVKIKASYIYIHENLNAGSITEIILFDENNNADTVFKPSKFYFPKNNNRIFKYSIPGGSKFLIQSAKLILSTARVPGFNEIEAIGISESDQETDISINQISDSSFKSGPKNLGSNINSEYPELAPLISSTGNQIYFTRNYYPENIGYNKLQDIWVSNKEDGIFQAPENLSSPINDEYSNFAISVTQDNNSLIIGNVYNKNNTPSSGISKTNKDGNSWTFPEEIVIQNYSKIGNLSSYCLGSDGKTLLLAFDNPASFGGTDLWVSFLNEDDSFSEPMNLGDKLNTADNEYSPFLAADGKTLYFSSKGYPGYGSYDLFYSKRLDSTWQKWSKPKNLGSKINSEGWDAYFTIPASGKSAYFVSTNNSIGAEDIFKINLPEELAPEKVILISGKVLNAKDKTPIIAKIFYENLKTGEQLGVASSNSDGEYNIILPSGEEYGIHAKSDNYVAINENFDLRDNSTYQELKRDLFLVPIEKGQKIRLNNIFFNFAEFDLLPNSYAELDRVVEMMEKRKSLKIKIEGHTDAIGTQERNLKLSKKRANSVKEYIISKGIPKDRLQIEGFGKNNPIDKSGSELARQRNRRVEFVIISE